MSDTGALVVFVTAPPGDVGVALGRAVVSEQLAACVNLVPGLRSIYVWEGALQDEPEQLLMMKTTVERFPALAQRIKALHPYSVPEIIALPIAQGQPDYLRWLAAGCLPPA